jgi:hypothetical protein
VRRGPAARPADEAGHSSGKGTLSYKESGRPTWTDSGQVTDKSGHVAGQAAWCQ